MKDCYIIHPDVSRWVAAAGMVCFLHGGSEAGGDGTWSLEQIKGLSDRSATMTGSRCDAKVAWDSFSCFVACTIVCPGGGRKSKVAAFLLVSAVWAKKNKAKKKIKKEGATWWTACFDSIVSSKHGNWQPGGTLLELKGNAKNKKMFVPRAVQTVACSPLMLCVHNNCDGWGQKKKSAKQSKTKRKVLLRSLKLKYFPILWFNC